jgi:hypothetical protein
MKGVNNLRTKYRFLFKVYVFFKELSKEMYEQPHSTTEAQNKTKQSMYHCDCIKIVSQTEMKPLLRDR